MQLYLHKASKKLGIHPRLLKADVKSGRLSMDDSGCINCEELRELYPVQFEKAMEQNLDYWEGIKETAKQLTSPDSDVMDKKRLYQSIRKLEAENFSLKKRIRELERLLEV